MPIFYTPEISSELLFLSEEESKHCTRVLRLQSGDAIELVDGRGGLYEAEIADANPKKCAVAIKKTHSEYGKRNFHLHIAIAPTKSMERFEWFLEKATEIGVDEITPLFCQRSERIKLNNTRLNKILIEAMKQSQRAYLPILNEAMAFDAFMKKANAVLDLKSSTSMQKFIAHLGKTPVLSLGAHYEKGNNCIVLIGPEGDFTEQELTLSSKHSFQTVTLGSNRLRTETAGVVACEIINFINEV